MDEDQSTEVKRAYREKLRSLAVIGRRTRPLVVEGRRADGVRVKATTDELGNTTTEHNTKDDRVDVVVRPQSVRAVISRSTGKATNAHG